MDGLDYGLGKEVVFYCQEGYVLYGVLKFICQSDGIWDAEVFFCKLVNCGFFEDFVYGFFNGFFFFYGGQIQY